MICGKLKNFDFSRINPLCVQSIKNNVLCLFPYLSNHLVIGPNFSFSHRSQSQGYKGGSQKFSPISLYRSRYMICGKMKNFDFSRINPLCVQSIKNNVLCLFPYLSNHLVIGPNFSFSHRSQSQGYKGGSQKFSPISLYRSRYMTCGK